MANCSDSPLAHRLPRFQGKTDFIVIKIKGGPGDKLNLFPEWQLKEVCMRACGPAHSMNSD